MEKEIKIGEWKELMVNELTDTLKENANFFLSNYVGLKSDEVNELRRSLESHDSKYLVVKNAIARIVFKNSGLKELVKFVEGDTGLAFGGNDAIAVARTMSKFAKTHEPLKFKGGYLDGDILDVEKIQYLASLPGREELIAKVVFGIKSPISGFVGVLSNTLKSFVYVVQAIKTSREGAA